jgi:hypothetical protein
VAFILVFFTVVSVSPVAAQQAARMDFIRAEIQRIDKLDGKEDGRIETGDSVTTATARRTYWIMPDSIDTYIRTAGFKEVDVKIYRDYLFRSLRRVNGRNYRRVSAFEPFFTQIMRELVALRKGNLNEVLHSNIPLAIKTCGLYRYESLADTFLCEAARQYPDEVLKNIDEYSDRIYAQHVVDFTAKYAPQVAKKYFLVNEPVINIMRRSGDTAIKVILKITDDIGKKSNAYVLLDDIMKGKLSIAQADSIGKDGKALLTALMEIRKQKDPLAAYSLDKELEVQALKFVRVVNDLHNEKEQPRFASVEKFTDEQFYTLIVYSEEEIFTSTFNGFFRRFSDKLGKKNGFTFLREMGENRFRTFIKQAASFGKLDSFLNRMTAEQRNMLLIKFAAGLDNDANNTSQAVEVADAYTSIGDPATQQILQQTIAMELKRVTEENNKKGMAIYGLLSNLFVNSDLFKEGWYQNISGKYKLPPLDVLPAAKFFETNGISVWHMYFYDDEDGDESFRAFKATFKDSMWTILDTSKLFIKITSKKGRLIEIYANKPKEEYNGQEFLENYFERKGIVPDVLIHRGHSYYAYKTIDKTQSSTKVFILGSCGGYHNLSNIIDKAPEINIISSKQIGVYAVNNPIVKELADNVRMGKDVNWQELWKKLDMRLKKEHPLTYSKFLDYIPPHKNLGAIFIRAYNGLIEN